jgi:hypothetical protein
MPVSEGHHVPQRKHKTEGAPRVARPRQVVLHCRRCDGFHTCIPASKQNMLFLSLARPLRVTSFCLFGRVWNAPPRPAEVGTACRRNTSTISKLAKRQRATVGVAPQRCRAHRVKVRKRGCRSLRQGGQPIDPGVAATESLCSLEQIHRASVHDWTDLLNSACMSCTGLVCRPVWSLRPCRPVVNCA